MNSRLAAAAASQAATNQSPANDDLVAEVRAPREEVEQLRSDNNAGHAANAGHTGALTRHLDNVTSASGGDAIATGVAAYRLLCPSRYRQLSLLPAPWRRAIPQSGRSG